MKVYFLMKKSNIKLSICLPNLIRLFRITLKFTNVFELKLENALLKKARFFSCAITKKCERQEIYKIDFEIL